ncbi:unnamed protein product [Closterium sp. Yama58-4]|nr:unnamed protein product [Closterium sp. Yama58-4]
MKIKVLSRSEVQFTRERKQDVQKVHRNLDPALHPLEKAKEYQRALNAVKLDKVFAKPFMGALGSHADGVSAMARSPVRLNCVVSASMDGDVRLWDVPYKRTLCRFVGHSRAVRGVAISSDGETMLSCGDDCTVRLWQLPAPEIKELGVAGGDEEHEAVATFQGKNAFRAVDHKWKGRVFATAGAQVDVWEHSRSDPIATFTWGADSVYSVRFNPAEPDVFATTGSDRSICLYDLRMSTPLRKVIMQTKTNSLAWNPREPLNFTAGNENGCCYSYDMRKLSTASFMHKDHVSAVMDIDYSPTGREFVTGSYDRTVRIFPYDGIKSREVYHTKRMQRVFCVRFSGDGSYVLSGSDDANIRLWKAQASQQLGIQVKREKRRAEYNAALVERHQHLPEIRRIHNHRHVPRPIHNAIKLRATMVAAEKRKEENRQRFKKKSKGVEKKDNKKKGERRNKIIAELETHSIRFPLVAKRLACMVLAGTASANVLQPLCHVAESGDSAAMPVIWRQEHAYIHSALSSLLTTAQAAGQGTVRSLLFFTPHWYASLLARLHLNAFRIAPLLSVTTAAAAEHSLLDSTMQDSISLSAAALFRAASAAVTGDEAVGTGVYLLASFFNHDCGACVLSA